MNKIKLKRIMTDVAKGKISEKDAQLLINQEKTQPDKPNKEKQGKSKGHTHKRKKQNNNNKFKHKEVK